MKRNGRSALVCAEFAGAVGDALLDSTGCVPAGLDGRGGLMRFPCGSGAGLVRHYYRGGAIRHFLRDRYLLRNPALRELRIHTRIHELGLPVPVPLGACWERRGLFYRAWLATQELPAQNLLACLQNAPEEEARDLFVKCGRTIRKMHDAGVYHADLQIRNILVNRDNDAHDFDAIYLIDFDKACIRPELSPIKRAQNLYRLRRSMLKTALFPQCFPELCRAYGVDALPEWMGRILKITPEEQSHARR